MNELVQAGNVADYSEKEIDKKDGVADDVGSSRRDGPIRYAGYSSFDLSNLSQPPQIRGCLERIDSVAVGGWCLDAKDVGRAVSLKIMFFGVAIGDAVTSLSRAEIESAVMSPCTAGFEIALDKCRLSPADLASIEGQVAPRAKEPAVLNAITTDGFVLPRWGDGTYTLTNGELFGILQRASAASVEASASPKPAMLPNPHIESMLHGFVEYIDEKGASGWCFHALTPVKPVPLSVSFLGLTLQKGFADQSRADVELVFEQPCKPGFEFGWSSLRLGAGDFRTLFNRVRQDPLRTAAIEVRGADGSVLNMLPGFSIRMTNLEAFCAIAASIHWIDDKALLDEFLDFFLKSPELFREEWAVIHRLFDVGAFCWTNRQASANADPIGMFTAYVRGHGTLQGPLFDDRHYLYLNPEARSDFPPLLHYAFLGRRLGLSPHHLFVPEPVGRMASTPASRLAYLEFLDGSATEPWHPIVDVVDLRMSGRLAGACNADILVAIHRGELSPHALFDIVFYTASCRNRGVTLDQPALYHYISIGWKLGLDPHPLFDMQYYLVDQKSEGKIYGMVDPLTLFIQADDKSRYSPSPFIDLLHLRHQMHLEGYTYSTDVRVVVDALENGKWISMHPHLRETMVGFVNQPDMIEVLRKASSTMADLSSFVGALRLGLLPSHLGGRPAPAIDPAAERLVSIIILNYNKPIFTLLSAYSAWAALAGVPSEVLVVDNGSQPFFLDLIYRYLNALPGVRVISNRKNLFFGEGNNVAIDVAVGKYILFQNNDAVVRRETVLPMIEAMEKDPRLGLLAPVLVLPDRRIQEAGGLVSACGQAIQESKFIPFEEFYAVFKDRGNVRSCDYASAACCVMRGDVARKVLGFDLLFEPFYFEDTDFCIRVRAQGYQVAVHAGAFAVHLENASTSEFLGQALMEVVGRQKKKFGNRWLGVFGTLGNGALTNHAEDTPRFSAASQYEILKPSDVRPGYSGRPVAWVYSPYEIRVGGGERYILSLAQALSTLFEVWFLTPNHVSRARLAMTMDDLAVRPGRLHTATLEETASWPRPELYVAMGNEIEPATPGYGRRNLYHCQFPFPIHLGGNFSIERIHGYDALVVNSRYTANAVERMLRKYGVPLRPIHVLSPPVSIPSARKQTELLSRKPWNAEQLSVVNIGRFMAGGHNKRQDIVLALAERSLNEKLPIAFNLFGGLNSGNKEDQAFYARLEEQASRTTARLRPNAARAEIEEELAVGKLYLHPCGMGCYPGFRPEQVEHFGITVVEAMSHGVVPVVYKWGGPAEIVGETGVGLTFETVEQAFQAVKGMLDYPAEKLANQMELAMQRSRRYSEDVFWETTVKIVESVGFSA